MRRRSGIRSAVMLALLVAATCSGPVGDWRARIVEAPLYRPPDAVARERIGRLFEEALGASTKGPPLQAWQETGFLGELVGPVDRAYLSLREASTQVEGKGRYLVRHGGLLEVALQAPHADTDIHTGEIAERLFSESSLVAAAFNSIPRWAVDLRGRPADLAHRSDSVLIVFTSAFLDRYPRGLVVQLHGFDSAKRESEAGSTADVIISDGTPQSQRHLAAKRDCLIEMTRGRVRLYPQEVTELGGTTNVVGRLVRDSSAGRFLHLELSLPFRQRLLSDASARRDFLLCLMTGIEA